MQCLREADSGSRRADLKGNLRKCALHFLSNILIKKTDRFKNRKIINFLSPDSDTTALEHSLN